MPYKATLENVEKVIKQLEELANAGEEIDIIIFKTSSPSTLKYAIHQAFYAAKEMKFQKYAELGEKWKVRIKGVNVVCERREAVSYISTPAKEEIKIRKYSVNKFAEIIGTLIAEGSRYEMQLFPGIIITDDEEKQLTDFAKLQRKKWYYDTDPLKGLTITNE